MHKKCTSYYWKDFSHDEYPDIQAPFEGYYNEFSTRERLKQFVALGKLLQLRDYWTNNWKNNLNSLTFVVFNDKNEESIKVYTSHFSSDYPLTFPTKEMADEFVKCFKDLIEKARPLV